MASRCEHSHKLLSKQNQLKVAKNRKTEPQKRKHASRKKKISRNKHGQTAERYGNRKLAKVWAKILQKTQGNGRLFRALPMEERTHFKCPYRIKQCLDCMQSQSKLQQSFPQKYKTES